MWAVFGKSRGEGGVICKIPSVGGVWIFSGTTQYNIQTMSTTYHPFKIALTDGQKKKLQKAYLTKTPVGLKVKPDQIGRGDELFLTETQIARLKKRSAAGKGMVINLSQTQLKNTAQRGGNLFSAMLGLARPLIKPALGALASAGLSFGAAKVLKKIFGKGFGPKEIEL